MEVEDDNRILKSIVRNNSGIMMYKRRYVLERYITVIIIAWKSFRYIDIRDIKNNMRK